MLPGFSIGPPSVDCPSAQTNACLANEDEVNRLVQIQSDAVATYNVPGTPAFVINGKLVEIRLQLGAARAANPRGAALRLTRRFFAASAAVLMMSSGGCRPAEAGHG